MSTSGLSWVEQLDAWSLPVTSFLCRICKGRVRVNLEKLATDSCPVNIEPYPVGHLKPLPHTADIRVCAGICHCLMSPNNHLIKLCSYFHASYLFWLLVGIEIL